MKNIDVGDIVDLFWTDDSQILNVKVLCITGGLWHFEGDDGSVRAVNVSSSTFDQIVKVVPVKCSCAIPVSLPNGKCYNCGKTTR